MTEETVASAKWHERTVDRSLKNARQRAISRGDKFIKAATTLLRQTGKADFTVQEVVDQSGMSLRSFYHHFATKEDLLLAVIEESVRHYTEMLTPKLAETEGADKKLELLLRTSYSEHYSDDPASHGLVLFHWNLAESRTAEFVETMKPQVDLITGILEEGIADGTFRDDLPISAQTSMVTHTILSLLDMRVLGVEVVPEQVTGDQLVEWTLTAVGARVAPANTRTKKKS